ncbi:alpha-1B-glycoprotein-like [Acomys russatus]|uniref:alpha-1B-glycoprotein-like n=1 Tax=Acomys russatus TaxID=60746 RepID=UPI0021E2FB3B|nr:alpha-1B-glycoprotein-like [Acomys russatus]
MSLLAAMLLLWGFPLGPATDAATCAFRDSVGQKRMLQPWLVPKPVPWVTPGLTTFLVCHGRVRHVAFVLKREDDGYQEIAETDGYLGKDKPSDFLEVTIPRDEERAAFVVQQPGNYSCSYLIHEDCPPSEPSDIVTIHEHVIPPPPVLTSSGSPTVTPLRMDKRTLVCEALLNDVEFQLRQGKRKLKVASLSTDPKEVIFNLKFSHVGDQSPFTCRYRLNSMTAWSKDSEPVELMWSDEKRLAPMFTAEPKSNESLEAGSTVQLRCTAPNGSVGLRFGLHREDPEGYTLLQTLKTSGNETVFQLHNLSAADSGSYSCIYTELAPPYSGSAPSEPVELTVNGPPAPPKLQALWIRAVPYGHNAVFRCQSKVQGVTMELLRDGKFVSHRILRVLSTSTDMELAFVRPEHTGNYTCRYISWGPESCLSEPSNPVELLVEGTVCDSVLSLDRHCSVHR